MTCALSTNTPRRAHRVATLCRRRGIWRTPRAGLKIPPSVPERARAFATVVAAANFLPPGGGHRAIRRSAAGARRSKEFAFTPRTRLTTHRRLDVNRTDYPFGGISTPRVECGAFPVRCAECRVLFVLRAH